MSEIIFTEREREYLECGEPMVSGGSAALRIVGGLFTSLLQAAFTPGSGKADSRLMRTVRDIRYTKYKKAVLRKQEGVPAKKDGKILEKLNKRPFVLENDTFDADEYTRKLYEEYMKKHEKSEE